MQCLSDNVEAAGTVHSSGCRGQVEPLAAIAAVLAVCAGLTLYAGTVDEFVGDSGERETVDIALDATVDSLSTAGVVSPKEVHSVDEAIPQGWHANVTVTADGVNQSAGPTPPPGASEGSRRVGVQVEPGTVRPGRVTVVVWR